MNIISKIVRIILFSLVFLNSIYCKKKNPVPNIDSKQPVSNFNLESNTSKTFEVKNYLVTAKGGLRLRSQPDINSKVLVTISENARVEFLEDTQIPFHSENIDGFWYKVVYKNQEGYAFSGFLKPLSDSIDWDQIPKQHTEEVSLWRPSSNQDQVKLNSYSFNFPLEKGEKATFFSFDKSIRKSISVTVSSSKFVELSDSGDSNLETGFLRTENGSYVRYEIEFESITDPEIIGSKSKYIHGILIYPPIHSIRCLPKKDLKELPGSSEDYLNFAVDTNNDKLADIVSYDDISDDYHEYSLFQKVNNNWDLVRKYSSKNYSFDENKKGFYPANYLCN